MRRWVVGALLALAAVVAVAWYLPSQASYHVRVLLGSANKIIVNGPVLQDGFQVGHVEDIAVRNGKAVITLALDDAGPLHDGASVRVVWKAVLGERWIEIADGPATHPEVPNGGLIPGRQVKPVEIDEVLNALDGPTRTRLSSLVNRLHDTLRGNEGDARSTLQAAGPALQALGDVLDRLGADGQAIRDLVTEMNGMVGRLSANDGSIRAIVDSLSRTTAAVVGQREQLGSALRQLPTTMDRANRTLGAVPGAAGKAIPLLHDLRPATRQLPTLSNRLQPVLRDLRPTVDELGPTLTSARALLGHTPRLLDTARGTIPGITRTAEYLEPALTYLRPYAPETVGWLASWASNAGNYDANGHYVRFQVQEGASTFGDNPGLVPPGFKFNAYPKPGENVGQPWRDAWGGEIR